MSLLSSGKHVPCHCQKPCPLASMHDEHSIDLWPESLLLANVQALSHKAAWTAKSAASAVRALLTGCLY